jgi:hypothetical protein
MVVHLSDPENFGPRWILECPKVFYNAKTKKYVMYMHIDGPLPGTSSTTTTPSSYGLARVGVAVSDTVDGEYRYLRSFRPLGHESRDIGQFVDDDGAAYLITEDRPLGFHIEKLSDDYLDVEKDIALVPMHLEGGALVHFQGLYYAIGSALTGWAPQPKQIRDGRAAGRTMVGLQGHRTARNEDIRVAVDSAAEGCRKQDDHCSLYGRYLEAEDPVGLTLSMDAAPNRRRPTQSAGTTTMDHQPPYWRGEASA